MHPIQSDCCLHTMFISLIVWMYHLYHELSHAQQGDASTACPVWQAQHRKHLAPQPSRRSRARSLRACLMEIRPRTTTGC